MLIVYEVDQHRHLPGQYDNMKDIDLAYTADENVRLKPVKYA